MSTGCLRLQRVPHSSQFASITGRFQLHHHSGPASYFPPCLPGRTQPASPGKRSPSAAVNQPECRRECGGYRGCFGASVRPGFLLISVDPRDRGARRFNERAFASQRAVGHARYDGTVQSSQGSSANSCTDSKKHGTSFIIYKMWKSYIDPRRVKSVYLKRPVAMGFHLGIYQGFQDDTCFAVRRVTFGHSLKCSNLKQAHARVHAHIISTSVLSPQQ